MEYLKKYKEWLENPDIDEETKEELLKIKDNEEEIKDRFYKSLEFGTAGLRGVVGAGLNRMNKYTVGKATQGLANYIIKNNGQTKGVAIAYDCRNMSKEFSKLAALILNANGIKTYRFESLRPTPELSFTVRDLNCISGIVITASHNPPKYNGYKVYWEDGAQISSPVDEGITNEVNAVKRYSEIKEISEEEAKRKGLYNEIGKELDDKYIKYLKSMILNPEAIQKQAGTLKIVYTPLCGTGKMLATRILDELGFKNVYVVPEQAQPNGNFPTLTYPNPEDSASFDLALKLAKKVDADIVIANDPDADRLGMHVKDTKTGEYILFNGNMIGLTVADYLINQKREKGLLKINSALIKTIVSSNMTDRICKENNVALFEVLTGFKNIASKIREFEKENSYECIMGYEESYGCLVGDKVRDKDGIAALMILSEAAAYYKNKGLTLWDNMKEMYKKYGYYREGQISITKEGADGAEIIKNMMEKVRNNPPKFIGKYKVLRFKDYQKDLINDFVKNEDYNENLPKSNVLYFELENDFWCCMRPSGTEPKIKFYMGVVGNNLENAEEIVKDLANSMESLME
ncbi:MAG: phospho-sugar mutase [Clostridia bacterium]|nr:phospho-sugar mutase [Clostridia bacterium]